MTKSPHDPAADLFASARDHAREQSSRPLGLPSVAEFQQRFPEFEVLGLIGQGGMGAVYKARDPRLDRLVAIKVLPPHLSADPAFGERFAQEARTLARLQHPNILTVYDYGERDGLPFLVTEFVDGVDLRRLIANEKLDPAEALRIVPQICDALQCAHEHGVVHRDVKPENILIDTRGHVRVADFGIAKILGAPHSGPALTATAQTLGTPHYTAPEVLRGMPVDHRADIYALGVLLYELLTGHVPIGRFASPSERAGTDRRLDDIVSRALRDEPDARYQQVAEVRADLQRPPEVREAPRSNAGERPPAKRRRRRWPIVLPIGVAGLFVALSMCAPVPTSGSGPRSTPGFSAGWLILGGLSLVTFVIATGFRRMDTVRRSGDPRGAAGAVCLAWMPILLAVNAIAVALLPELSDRDATRILEVAVVALLVAADIAVLVAVTKMLRSDALRNARSA